MAGIGEIRLPDGRVVRFSEWTDMPLYSTADIQHGAAMQEIRLFQYVVGDPVAAYAPAGGAITARTSTDRDTNISVAGGLSRDEEFMLYSIRPEVHVATLTTTRDFTAEVAYAGGEPIPTQVMLAIFNRHLLLRLRVSQRKVVDTPFGYFNTGFGPASLGGTFGYQTNTNNAVAATQLGQGYGNPGVPSADAVRAFAIPHQLNGADKFSLELANPGGGALNFAIHEYATGSVATKVAHIRMLIDGLYKRPVGG